MGNTTPFPYTSTPHFSDSNSLLLGTPFLVGQAYKEYVRGDPYLDASKADEALIKRIVAKGGDIVQVSDTVATLFRLASHRAILRTPSLK